MLQECSNIFCGSTRTYFSFNYITCGLMCYLSNIFVFNKPFHLKLFICYTKIILFIFNIFQCIKIFFICYFIRRSKLYFSWLLSNAFHISKVYIFIFNFFSVTIYIIGIIAIIIYIIYTIINIKSTASDLRIQISESKSIFSKISSLSSYLNFSKSSSLSLWEEYFVFFQLDNFFQFLKHF